MSRTSAANVIRRDLKYFGFFRTVVDVFFRAVNCLVYFRIVQAIKLEVLRTEYLVDHGFHWRFFSDGELTALAADKANEITPQFLRESLPKGDRCYGATDGDALVTYAWLSHKPTNADGMYLHVDPRYVYLFKAYTNPNYRGHRANVLCVHRCLQNVLSHGYRGLIADIDANNFASLHAAYRMGFERFGRATILVLGRIPFMHQSRGCREYGYYFAKTPHEPNSVSTVGKSIATEDAEGHEGWYSEEASDPQISQLAQL